MNAERKVIDFNTASRAQHVKIGVLVAECRSLFQKEFKPILVRFFGKVDDELFTLSDKAVSSTQQEMYFEAMRYLRREREQIERSYLHAVLKGYDEFWTSPSRPVCASQVQSKSPDEDDFALVEHEDLEEELAVSTLINKGNTSHHRDLYALNQRFAKVLGRAEVGDEENPVAPHRLGHSFADVLRPLTLELKVKLILFKLYERYVIGELEGVYDFLNEALAKHGVLPEIPRKPKQSKTRSSGHSNEKVSEKSPEYTAPADQTAYIQAIQAMHTLLSAWRSQVGLPSLAANASEPGVVVSETREVLGALSALQDPEVTAQFTEALQSGEDANLKQVLADRLKADHGDKRTLAQMDEDIIDMIGMIFDFILDDRHLPATVKALIGRLQIPIVKVAILDKSFFSKKTHPARLLLNQLAHAGISLTGDEELEQNPVFRQINSTVARILGEFAQDVGLFGEVLEEFSQFMEQEGQRSQRLEERARQATQSKEHLLLAKKEVAEEIAARLRDRALSPRLKHFLTTHWKDVLLLSCLRKEKSPDEWQAKLALTNTLLWTLSAPQSNLERKRMGQRIPGLLRALRHELEGISLDPKQIALFFKELESVHQALLSPEGDSVDPRIERELEAVSANLPEVDDLELGELTDFQDAEIEEEIIMISEAESAEEGDEFLKRVSRLEVGDWLELTDSQGKTLRVKLSWISKVTGLRVFVNRRGMKVAEYTLNGLAAEMRRGGAKIIDGKVPLMDRALSAMMTTLKHPAKQQEGDESAPPSSGSTAPAL
ncbi:MAG: DUF1631 domain-containing protein [Methylothermaceae bacterium]|nr:DUF1631 domain-containing protein [Methylothermaceae bacterium]